MTLWSHVKRFFGIKRTERPDFQPARELTTEFDSLNAQLSEITQKLREKPRE